MRAKRRQLQPFRRAHTHTRQHTHTPHMQNCVMFTFLCPVCINSFVSFLTPFNLCKWSKRVYKLCGNMSNRQQKAWQIPQSVYILDQVDWVMSVCLWAKGIWLSCRAYCSVCLVDVLFVSIHLFAFFQLVVLLFFVGFGCSALIASLQQVAKLLSQNWLIRCQLPTAFGSRHPSATWPNQSMCLSALLWGLIKNAI